MFMSKELRLLNQIAVIIIKSYDEQTEIILKRADLNKGTALKNLINSFKPQIVFHLAAFAEVGRSFQQPKKTMEVNTLGTLNLYELLRDKSYLKKVIFVSSADVFGPLPQSKMPIKPDYPLNPVSPYGVSKAAADMLSYQYFMSFKLPVIRIRAFNHTGPRQTEGFVIPDFCSQITAFEKKGRKGTIKVGNLSAKRDLSDVRDIVNGYRLAAENGEAGEIYLLASGKADKINSYLKLLLRNSKVAIDVKVLKRLIRPVEVPLLVGDIKKAQRKLGYEPKYNIERTLLDTLEYWRKN